MHWAVTYRAVIKRNWSVGLPRLRNASRSDGALIIINANMPDWGGVGVNVSAHIRSTRLRFTFVVMLSVVMAGTAHYLHRLVTREHFLL